MTGKFYTLILLLFISLSIQAQEREIRGTVVGSSANIPIPGVNVVVKNTAVGAVTDFDGRYTIDASPNDTLVFSYIGYLTKQRRVGNKTQIDIELAKNQESLAEVVIVGYGSQKREDITGAVSTIDGESFEERPNNSVGSLMQGQAAGVRVLNNSGKPSQGFNIRIRGTNSIRGNSDPLYVIDGVPTQDTRSLNPADIESISVLKDASSAAIYGAQGANGVVLINTKKGKTGKPRVQYSTYVGFQKVWNTLDVLNAEQYRSLVTELGYNTDWSQYDQNTDWQDQIFNTGISQNHQVSISGKKDGTSYYLAGGYVKQNGAVRSAEMRRYNYKFNFSKEINDWWNVGTNITYNSYADVDVTDNQAVNQGGVLLGVLATPPNIGIFRDNGTYTSNPFQDWENPFASTDGADRKYKTQRLLGNVFTEFNIFEDFEFRSNFGIEYINSRYDYFLDPFSTSYGRANQGISQYNTNLTNYYIFDNTLKYENTFGDHKIGALVGTIFQKYRYENSSIETRNFASGAIPTPNAGSQITTATADKAEKANSSFISRVNYDYKKRYLLTANFRADGSSNFGPENRWGYFPSVSAGWRISQEEFLKDTDWMSQLKLRAGWGIVGNDQVGQYAYYATVASGSNYPIGGVIEPGTYPERPGNQALKWEESEQLNLGVDFSLWDNKLSFSADVYRKTTHDLLLNAPLPRTTGFESAVQNIGSIENRGLELQLNTVNIDNGRFLWTTNANMSFNRNEVKDILGQEIFDAQIPNRSQVSLVREGQPLGTLYGYVYGGVDPQTGNAYYIDQNGESTFNPTSEDRRIIGDANPDFRYGIRNNLKYDNFGLTIFIQGIEGNDLFNATRVQTEGMIDSKNQLATVLDRWREPGDQTNIPKALRGDISNSRVSTRFLEDESYMRFKAVTLSYDLPSTVLDKLALNSLKLYVTGENLITLTNYSGFDPEVNAYGGSNNVQGIDFGTYPQTRNFIFGMDITF